MAISRMQEPRQLYGLGSLVKKAVRGVKKVVKSPLGKIALGGALAFGLPGTQFGGLLGRASFGGPASSIFGKSGGVGALFNQGKAALAKRFGPANFVMNRDGPVKGKGGFFSSLNPFGGNFSGKNAFLTAGALATAAPFIADMYGDDEVEEEYDVMDIADIRNRARDYYRGATDTGLEFMPGKSFVQPNFYAAAGGRAMLNMGGGAGEQQAQQMLMMEFVKYKNKGGTLSFEQFVKAVMQQQAPEGAGMEQPMAMAANGGRIGLLAGGPVPDSTVPGYTTPAGYNKFDYRSGGVPVRGGKQEGGIMETEVSEEVMPLLDMGGKEKDYRETGGFVELGRKERADDVPARLSKNEFVFTADAVRNAGGGDIDRGAEVMENLMNNLEQGGEISEESQGLEGAQAMYDQQQMLQSRIV